MLGARSKAVQWPWCSAGKAVICFLAVARMRSGALELHNSDTGPALSYPDHCTLCSLPPQSQFLHPPPRPSWPDCARQAPVLGFCCGRVVAKCCCEVLLRSVVAMAASPDTKMKVVMLGKEATGKTSLVERFLSGRFQGEGQVKSTIAGAYGGRYLLLVQ